MMTRSVTAWLYSLFLPFVLLGFGARLTAQTMCGAGTGTACVLTWQNDNWRTGQNRPPKP